MRSLKKIIFIQVSAIFLLLVINGFVFAQRPLEVGYPTIERVRPQDISFALPEYVKYIFNFSLAIAGFVVFVVLIYSGFRYLTSAGSPTAQKDARTRIFSAILGLIILLSSYLILTTINPQLVFLSIPERAVFTPELINKVEPIEKETLYYSEVPIGGLIGDLLSNERISRIKNITENIKSGAENIESLSQQLEELVKKCQCSSSVPNISSCGCNGPFPEFCVNDPCGSYRPAIKQKQKELENALSRSETLKGLEYWRKKLDIEINGSAKEKIIGFKQVYDDLKKAEDLIKNCPLSSGPEGNTQTLLGHNDFWQYRQKLEEDQSIKKAEPTYPFDYISSDNPYYLATFYCVETLYSIVPEPIDEEYFNQVVKEIGTVLGSEEEVCSSEIPVGETADNTEELAKRILPELNDINSAVLNDISLAENLIVLTNENNCNAKNCSLPSPPYELSWVWICTASDEETGACTAGYWQCAGCRVRSPCQGGSPCPFGQISDVLNQIQSVSDKINITYEKIKNLLEEKNIPDELKRTKIFETLKLARNELGVCYNSKEAQRMAETGKKMLWKELYPCSDLKESIGGPNLFYNESGQKINDCYGPTPVASDLLDNFLCCESEIF